MVEDWFCGLSVWAGCGSLELMCWVRFFQFPALLGLVSYALDCRSSLYDGSLADTHISFYLRGALSRPSFTDMSDNGNDMHLLSSTC